MTGEKPKNFGFRKPPALAAFFIFALAFASFYFSSYFSAGYRGMLGYETKDTLTQLQAYFNSSRQGAALYWDPIYFQYNPRVPQAPIASPVTQFFVGLARLGFFNDLKSFMPPYLLVLALLQVGCGLTMYWFLRREGFGFWPAVTGGLVYAYNHQTFAFGIRHGYERISAVLLAPLFIGTFFRLLESPPSSPRRRFFTAATGLLVGLALICNGDIKPTIFFCAFLVLAAVFSRPFSFRNLAALAVVFILAGGIFAAQGLPTVYSLPEQGRGEESAEQAMDYSLSPAKLLLTHFWTGLTPRPDYPWENTAEFSMVLMPLVVLGLFNLGRQRRRNVILAGLIFSCLWMMGKYLPTAPAQGWLMRLLAVRHPNRMAILLYFCYGFLAAAGLRGLMKEGISRVLAACLLLIPASMLALRLGGAGDIPGRFIVFSFLSCFLLIGISRRLFPARAVVLLALFFILERTTVFQPAEKIPGNDPTAYYTFDEIYRAQPRVKAILDDPDHRRWRAFFGSKDYPDLFSHNLYLNAYRDGIRPIFPYFYIDEEFRRVRKIQEVIFSDWSHPMWSLLNVKYFVDLEGYFASWDEEDTSRAGLDALVSLDEHVRVNPGAEDELFLRYRRARSSSDEQFLEGLRAGNLSVESTAYLDELDPALIFVPDNVVAAEEAKIQIVNRKPDGITAQVSLSHPGVLVFSEFWFFPWRVTVDGLPRSLRRAYLVLQAVELEPGEHLVSFYFDARHPLFLVPGAVSALLILLSCLYCLRQYRTIKNSGRTRIFSGKGQN